MKALLFGSGTLLALLCLVPLLCAVVVSGSLSLVFGGSVGCGSVFNVTVDFGGRLREAGIYLPLSLCYAKEKDASGQSGKTLAVPMLLALHCYGLNCANSKESHKWEAAADRYSVAVVSPKGGVSKPCWNAVDCCGDCLTRNDDDTGFVVQLLSALIQQSLAAANGNGPNTQQFSAIFGSAKRRLSKEALFVSGFSNGGYMSDYLTILSASGRVPLRFVASAPLSGWLHRSNGMRFMQKVTANKPINAVPILLQIGSADAACLGSKPGGDPCVPLSDKYNQYLRWYFGNRVNFTEQNAKKGISVKSGVSNCTLHESGFVGACVHKGMDHHAFGGVFPLLEETMQFFLKHLCLRHGGHLYAARKTLYQNADEKDETDVSQMWISNTPFKCECAPNTEGNWCAASKVEVGMGAIESEVQRQMAQLSTANRAKRKEDYVLSKGSHGTKLGVASAEIAAVSDESQLRTSSVATLMALLTVLFLVTNCDRFDGRKDLPKGARHKKR